LSLPHSYVTLASSGFKILFVSRQSMNAVSTLTIGPKRMNEVNGVEHHSQAEE
jgi:hypothetical protein